MKHTLLAACAAVVLLISNLPAQTQPAPAVTPGTQVPTLVRFAGTVTQPDGQPRTGTIGMTFLFYKDQQGGAPLWMETQNVQLDPSGHYSVMLGATHAQGLPTELFASGEARWLATQPEGQKEQTRVLLLSVPYALKAGDAATLGGLPPSAFALAGSSTPANGATVGTVSATANGTVTPATSSDVTTSGGTVNAVPLFTTGTNLQNSILTQTGSNILNVGGRLNLPATGTATATTGDSSQQEVFTASSFNSGTSAAVPQNFLLRAEPVGNNTTSPSGSLNLLFASGTSSYAETGLKISNKGLISFATGQTFPVAGSVTSVGLTAPSSDFKVSGSPVTKSGSLGLSWITPPTSGNTANAIVKRDSTGSFSANTINAATANIASHLIVSGTGDAIDAITGNSAATAVSGNAISTSGPAWGVLGQTASNAPNAYGVYGNSEATSGAPNGVYGSAHASGAGVYGQNSGTGYGVYGLMSGSAGQGVWGETMGTGFVNSAGSDGVHGVAHSNSGAGVAGINDATDAAGVWGSDTVGYGFLTDSHVSQARTQGGWVKAMVYANINDGTIYRCFNSQVAGSVASTTPCGITSNADGMGNLTLDFGFEIDDRFVIANAIDPINFYYYTSITNNHQLEIYNNYSGYVFVIVF